MHCLNRNCVRGRGFGKVGWFAYMLRLRLDGGKRGRAGRGKGFVMLGIECVGTASN